MLYKNANLFVGGNFQPGSFRVEDGHFTEILDFTPDEAGFDLGGAYVIPGLIDVHNHGNSGADFSDGDYEGLVNMARYLAQNGITSFAPASMTLPYEVLEMACRTAVRLRKEKPAGCARIEGIQMEGPFFSEKKKGAQNGAYLKTPDFEAFVRLYDVSEGLIRIADVAAELPGATEFTEKASKLCTVSVAHTDCTYDEAKTVFASGARHLTHLYNAMPGIHHRKPGPIGAASERGDVVAELICDGQHVHESAVRMAYKLFPGRICLISDALRCCGMPDGQYTLGGQDVFLKGGIARLADGTIAGSATNLYDCMCKAIDFGIPKEQAILSATLIPAQQLGKDCEIGSIAVGKRADFVVCDQKLNRQAVYICGEKVQKVLCRRTGDMHAPTLVIMAAGMGSRFGGLKQITPVDEQGHIIIDFSLFDAWRAGFRDLVFIIKPEMEESFREVIGSRMEKYFNITYVHQTIHKLPVGYSVPEGREKPWGTGHAVLCCKDVVDGPFTVINADDFYGPTAFSAIYDYLVANEDESQYAMVGYRVRNTVTENGSVARGVCQVENGLLTGVTEHTKIFKNGTDAKYTEDGESFVDLAGETIVSMNFWGFTPKMLQELDARFAAFLDGALVNDPLKGEYFLPSVVNDQLQAGSATVRVLPCEETWYGVTYREDLDSVKKAIANMKKQGIYEENLWN